MISVRLHAGQVADQLAAVLTFELVGQFGAKTPTQLLNSSKAVLSLGLLASCDAACSVMLHAPSIVHQHAVLMYRCYE